MLGDQIDPAADDACAKRWTVPFRFEEANGG
jgi:hypothetical protein